MSILTIIGAILLLLLICSMVYAISKFNVYPENISRTDSIVQAIGGISVLIVGLCIIVIPATLCFCYEKIFVVPKRLRMCKYHQNLYECMWKACEGKWKPQWSREVWGVSYGFLFFNTGRLVQKGRWRLKNGA